MDPFKLENQYQLYLQRVGLIEPHMHQQQRTETRRAFMGACGQMLLLLRDDVSSLEEKDAINKMDDLLNQVELFWLRETNQTD